MKVTVEIQETARYMHTVEVEIPDTTSEDDFDELLENTPMRGMSGLDMLVSALVKKYGKENVELVRDESPESEFEYF